MSKFIASLLASFRVPSAPVVDLQPQSASVPVPVTMRECDSALWKWRVQQEALGACSRR
jgi:hypothetical protein